MSEVSSSSNKRVPRGLASVVALIGLSVAALLSLAAPSGAQGYSSTPTCRVTPASVAPGGTVTVVAEGFLPGSIVQFSIDAVRSSRAPIGQAEADASGTATAQLTIPAGLADGQYTVTCSGLDANGVQVEVASVVRVAAAPGGGGGNGGNGGTGSDDLARTGSNTGSLVRVALLLVAAGGAVLLTSRKRAQRGDVPA